MSLTFTQLRDLAAARFDLAAIEPDDDSVTHVVDLKPDDAVACGRRSFTVVVVMSDDTDVLMQIAVLPDDVADDDIPLALAACNASNDTEIWPTATLHRMPEGRFDIRFSSALDIDAGLTATVDDALRFFPVHVLRCLKRIHADFGL